MRYLALIVFISLSWSNPGGASAASIPAIDESNVPEYDYSQTRLIVFYGEEGHVILASPFDYPAPVVGALVYEIILRYVPQFEEVVIPPENPTHVMDLLMEDRHGERRIGQRLYVGEHWLSEGKSIAFMSPEDYQRMAGILDDRYEGIERYPFEQLADLRRPDADEIPGDWRSEQASVRDAMTRMGLDEGEGAVLKDAEQRGLTKDMATTQVPTVEARAEPNDPVSRPQKAGVDNSRVNDSTLTPPPGGDVKHIGATDETSKGEIRERDRQPYAVPSLVGAALLFIILFLAKQKDKIGRRRKPE